MKEAYQQRYQVVFAAATAQQRRGAVVSIILKPGIQFITAGREEWRS